MLKHLRNIYSENCPFIAFSLYETSDMINCNHYELKMSGKTEMGKSFARRTHRTKKNWSEGADDLQKQQILRRALTSRICGYFLTLFCRETKRKDKAKQQIVGETDRAWFCGFGSEQKVIEAIPTMDTKACSWFIECKMGQKASWHKGTFHLRFSGIRPLRGYPPPLPP